MALSNVSVASSSPQILYQPPSSWIWITDDIHFDAGGSHMVTSDPDASAMITYTFVSFYLYAPRWPYQVACQITTGNTTSIVDLQDHTVPDLGLGSSAKPTVKSSIVFKGGREVFGTQTIRISLAPGTGFAVVDMIVFETSRTIGAGDSPVVSTINSTAGFATTSIATVPSTSKSNQLSSKNVIPWIVLTVGIVLLLIALAIAIFIWKFRRKPKKAPRECIDPDCSSVSRDMNTLHTAQSSSLSGLDSVETESLAVNSFGHRHPYGHSPNASVSESLAPQSREVIIPRINVHGPSTPLLGAPVVTAGPSQSRQTEASRRFYVANGHEENEPSTSCPPSYSFAVASGSVLNVRPVDRKYPC